MPCLASGLAYPALTSFFFFFEGGGEGLVW